MRFPNSNNVTEPIYIYIYIRIKNGIILINFLQLPITEGTKLFVKSHSGNKKDFEYLVKLKFFINPKFSIPHFHSWT